MDALTTALTKDILQILQEEKAAYTRLVAFSQEKRKAIVANDADALDKVVQGEKAVLGEIEEAEQKRLKNTASWAAKLTLPPHEVTVSLIAAHIDGGEGELLLSLQEEFLEILTEQMKQNEINRELLKSKLEYLNSMIKTLTQEVQLTNTYGKDGGTVDAQGGGSIGINAEV